MMKPDITIEEVKDLFRFDDSIKQIKLKNRASLYTGGMLLNVSFTKNNEHYTIPIIYYDTTDYIFTPRNWKDCKEIKDQPEVLNYSWRMNDTMWDAPMGAAAPMPYKPDMKPAGNQVAMTRTHIGYQIRTAREKAGLTLRQLAEKCEMRYSHLARIERGRNGSNVDTIANIATVLGMKLTLEEIKTADLPEEADSAPDAGQVELPDNPQTETEENMDIEN